MPQPAEEHGHHQIDVGAEAFAQRREGIQCCPRQADTAQHNEPNTGVGGQKQDEAKQKRPADEREPRGAAVPTHGDVQVIFEPTGQTDVPAFPEFTNVSGFVRRTEINRQVEPHQQCNADGHVRVSAEVGVHLEAVRIQADEVFKSTVAPRVGKDAVYHVDGEVIGQPDFLDQPVEDPKQTRSKFNPAEPVGLMELRDEGFGANDGPRYQLREKTHEKPKIQHAAHRLDFLSVHVDGVRHGLEGVERNPHRQEDLIHAERRSQMRIRPLAECCVWLTPMRSEQRLQGVRNEVRVLEVQQHAEVDDQTRCKPTFSLRTLRAIHSPANPPI